MTNNSAVVKIVANHTHEMSELQTKYKNLMEVHLATLKKYHGKCLELDEIKSYPKIVYQLGSDSKEYTDLISNFLNKLLAFNYALPTEPQIIELREWLEAMVY